MDSRRCKTFTTQLFVQTVIAKTAMVNRCHIQRLLQPKSAVKKVKGSRMQLLEPFTFFWRHFVVAIIFEYSMSSPQLLYYKKNIHVKLLLRRFCSPDNPGILSNQLITHTTKAILKQSKLPILHTNKGNVAISLYEKIGYKLTRDMNWWLYSRK